MITNEEQEIIHQFVILTLARKALELDLHHLEKVALKLKEPYTALTRSVLDHLSRELSVLKRYMLAHQLKVVPSEKNSMFTKYNYYCRGYEGTKHYLNMNLKNQVSQYISNCFTNGSKH